MNHAFDHYICLSLTLYGLKSILSDMSMATLFISAAICLEYAILLH